MGHTAMAVGAFDVLAGTPTHAATQEPDTVALQAPETTGTRTLERMLVRRRSVRNYSPKPLPLAAVSQLLWAAQGITAPGGRRTAPSAGALYPLELQLVAVRVEDLAAGLYRYLPGSHRLRRVSGEVDLPALLRAAYRQQALAQAAAVVVIAAVEQRTAPKYGARTGQFVAFEAGAASQNLALQVAALGLGTVVIGAFDDSAVVHALRLAPGERPLALMPVGRLA